MSKTNIILIGPMGSGKSTIGNLLSKKLHREFIDSDHFIEHKTGVDIPRIFDVEGEEGFRQRETDALKELSQLNDIVLATGGGSVIKKENQHILNSAGFIVFLDTSIHQQMHRLKKDKKRPLLQTDDPKSKLEELLKQRKPIYQELADFTIKTDHKYAKSILNEIIKNLPNHIQ